MPHQHLQHSCKPCIQFLSCLFIFFFKFAHEWLESRSLSLRAMYRGKKEVLQVVLVLCFIAVFCIESGESHAVRNHSEYSESGRQQPEHSQSGHHQSEHSRSDHHQSEDSQSGHHQSEHSLSGHHQSEHSQSGHHQSEHSLSGHHQSEQSLSGHHQSEHSLSGHHQSEYSESGHQQPEHSQSGHHQSEHSLSGHHQSEHSQSDHRESENIRSDHHQSKHSQSYLFNIVRKALQAGCETQSIHLDLSYKNLTDVPATLFTHSCAGRVTSLDLSHNRLHTLDPGSLAPMTGLTALDISHNQLHTLERGVLVRLALLREVNLSDNDLADLAPGSLPAVLVALNASFNRLTQLRSGIFRNVPFLTCLDLSHNNISDVQPGVFHPGMKSVFWVNLSYNRLSSFEPWPYVLSQRAHVDLSHNIISRFTNRMNFTLTREMYGEVNLAYNNLTHLYRHDIAMYLKSEALSAIALAFFFKLNLRHNPIVCDCHVHWVVDTLTDNLLADNDDAQTYFKCAAPPPLRDRPLGFLLSHAHLLVCDVTEGCPEGCRCVDTPHRRHVAVTCDPRLHVYTCLPQQLPGDGLLSLNLSGHALRRLEIGRCEVSRLQVLDVSDNRVRQISASFLDAASHLQVLNLKNNQLTSLPSNLQRLSVDNLHLSGNPLRCSCDLVWFGNWVKAVAANTSLSSSRPPATSEKSLPNDTDYPRNGPQFRADQRKVVFVYLSKPDSEADLNLTSTETVLHVPKPLPDSLTLKCSLPDGRKVAVVETSTWGRSCGSRVTLHVLLGGGAALLAVLAGMGVCWRWRYEVRILLSYCCRRVFFCCPNHRPVPYDIEAKPDEPVLHVHGVYVSIDEKDDGVVTWVTSWLLPLLEDRGHNSLSVYFPLRQEVPGVFKAENRVQAISQSHKVLVVLSRGYASNGWCRHEFDHACGHLQHHNHNNLVIVLLDNDLATDRRLAADSGRGVRNNHGCNIVIRNQADDEGNDDDHHLCIMNCHLCNTDTNDDEERNDRGDASALRVSFCRNGVLRKNTANNGVSDRKRDDNAVPERNRNCNAVPDRNRDEDIVPDRNRDDDAVPDRNHNRAATRVVDIDLDMTMNNTDDIDLDMAGNDRENNHDLDTAGRGEARRPHQTRTNVRKKKRRPRRTERRDWRQLEEMSEFREAGEVMALEPLRSFLMEGRHLSTSDRFFKYKLLFELGRQRRETQT